LAPDTSTTGNDVSTSMAASLEPDLIRWAW
jgi:hypothetical protein